MYGKKIPTKLLQKIRLASVRFNDGGSGSFVSPNGLVLTNHHVAMGQLQKLSNSKNDYVKNGFYAKNQKEEIKCPDLELNILVSLENVTEKVTAAYKNKTDLHEIKDLKKEIIAKIEDESQKKTKLRSDVIELYEGGEFWLYRYKKYTDIRLVFAPEIQAAAFGGDLDNFQYPRFCLDFTFFRVYENGKPIVSKDYLKWNSNGPQKEELLFVSGHPGSTDRDKTLQQIVYMRDHYFPETLKIIESKLKLLREFSQKGKDEARIAKNDILGLENSYKALNGEYSSLKDKDFYQKIIEKENNLKADFSKNANLSSEFGDPWKKISDIIDLQIQHKKEIFYYRLSGSIANYGLGIIRYAIEIQKPSEKRYEEFRDSSLDSWKHKFLGKVPIYKNKEMIVLKHSIEQSIANLGKDDKFVKAILQNKTPEKIVQELISKTQLDSPEFRKSLLESKPEEILQNKDPLLQWIIQLEPLFREKRDWIEKEIETPLSIEGGKLAKIKFAMYGKSTYPDATFTLRLAYGKMKGYSVEGFQFPPFTTYHGLLDRAYSFQGEPFQLSEKIQKNISKINLQVPLNFVSTHDITGGNSGSPVINSKGELVGLIFDGNAYSHSTTYIYSDEKARSVSVHSAGIIESLKNIYRAKNLVQELENQK
jgi:hypothetical protein